MSTRGVYGFRKNGIDKLTYNHGDSYPEWLGKNMLNFCKVGIEKLNDVCDRIILVEENVKPNQEQIYTCVANEWGNQSNEWYDLLRYVQGQPSKYLKSDTEIYMIDNKEFIKESLYCEYGYIINLDTNMFEFWEGFQKEPQENNRYGCDVVEQYVGGYYPCKMTLEIPIQEIYCADNVDTFLKKLS